MNFSDLIPLIGSLLFAIIRKFLPDFPLSEETFIAFFTWLLIRFGIIANRVKKAEMKIGYKFWKY
ncbi:MAG: hypothetical protein ACTSVV_14395 [Promethearchaeota archaeon]